MYPTPNYFRYQKINLAKKAKAMRAQESSAPSKLDPRPEPKLTPTSKPEPKPEREPDWHWSANQDPSAPASKQRGSIPERPPRPAKYPPTQPSVHKLTPIKPPKREYGKAKVLSREQFDRAEHKALERSMFPTRDRMLIMLSRYGGLRAKEIASIHVEDFTDAEGTFLEVLHVVKRGAKYGKARTIPLRPELADALCG